MTRKRKCQTTDCKACLSNRQHKNNRRIISCLEQEEGSPTKQSKRTKPAPFSIKNHHENRL